jgi:hypothetical protein
MSETSEIIYLIGALVFTGILAGYVYLWQRDREQGSVIESRKPSPTANLLKVQAYERLVVLVERIGFSSLLQRLPAGSLSAKQLAEVYIEAMRNEFEYNLTQQIYVSATLWQAVCDARDQQMFIIRKLLEAIPENASGSQLEASIHLLQNADQNASIQTIVLDAVKKEARLNLTSL